MTISSPTFQRLQSGVIRADDLRVKEPVNAMMKWLTGDMLTQLNAHFDAVSTSISAAIVAFSNSISLQIANHISVYASTRPNFLAHKNAVNQDSISTAQTPITFGTEAFDVGGYFSSDAYTPPAGTYRFTVSINWTTLNAVDNELLQIHLRKNGSVVKSFVQGRAGTNFTSMQINVIDQANGTDAYDVSAQKGGAGVGRIDGTTNSTWFCAEAIA